MEISSHKKEIRKEILQIRKTMDFKQKLSYDNIIEEKFLKSDYYKNSNNIFIYISFGTEINTKKIINKAINDGKKVYVPKTEFDTKFMDAVEIKSLDSLRKDRYGILEPEKKEPYINPNELDLIVVPGVAFDKSGCRLGYGAGYYDRYFKRISKDNIKSIAKIALAYDFQILKKIPMDEQDVPVDYIITEKI